VPRPHFFNAFCNIRSIERLRRYVFPKFSASRRGHDNGNVSRLCYLCSKLLHVSDAYLWTDLLRRQNHSIANISSTFGLYRVGNFICVSLEVTDQNAIVRQCCCHVDAARCARKRRYAVHRQATRSDFKQTAPKDALALRQNASYERPNPLEFLFLPMGMNDFENVGLSVFPGPERHNQEGMRIMGFKVEDAYGRLSFQFLAEERKELFINRVVRIEAKTELTGDRG